MCGKMRHRGPDDEGVYVNSQRPDVGKGNIPWVGLGHRRLSIIDLDGGHQPIHNEDKTVWVICNGEIYNYKELRTKLISSGHKPYTNTDTEVIVHLYEEYGVKCLQYLQGMFAFALWDERQKQLFIAKDRLGKKPVYYCWDNSTFIFASELKSILAYPGFKRTLDINGLIKYLQYGYIPEPLSIFKGVYKLPAGHKLTLTDGKLVTGQYWDASFTTNNLKNEQEVYEELLEKIKESVRYRLISDVPLGAFLSGGIDSSVIVALMAQEMSQPVKTFSIGFEESEFNELPYARKVAERFGTEHYERVVKPESFDLVEDIIRYFDEPFGDASAIPTYYVSKLASEHVKVVLSGDGGDELFAGYDRYADTLGKNRFEELPLFVRKGMRILSENLPHNAYGKNFLYNVSLPMKYRYIDYVTHVSSRRHNQLLSDDMLGGSGLDNSLLEDYFKGVKSYDPVSQMQYVDLKTYLPGDILVKVDRMSMAHSLEVRVPLLDYEVVEYVNALPSKYKMNGSTRKYIFRKIAEDLLPEGITGRKKQGFGVPLKYWFKGGLKGYMHQILLESRTSQRGYFNKKYIQKLIGEHERGRRDNSALLWHLVIFEKWHRLYIDT